jgi:hypothetical protein
MKLPKKMCLMHVEKGLGVQEHLVVNVKTLEKKINQLIDYLAEREAEESEAYAQGWNEGQQALSGMLKHEQQKFLDGFGHPKNCPECHGVDLSE